MLVLLLAPALLYLYTLHVNQRQPDFKFITTTVTKQKDPRYGDASLRNFDIYF